MYPISPDINRTYAIIMRPPIGRLLCFAAVLFRPPTTTVSSCYYYSAVRLDSTQSRRFDPVSNRKSV